MNGGIGFTAQASGAAGVGNNLATRCASGVTAAGANFWTTTTELLMGGHPNFTLIKTQYCPCSPHVM